VGTFLAALSYLKFVHCYDQYHKICLKIASVVLIIFITKLYTSLMIIRKLMPRYIVTNYD